MGMLRITRKVGQSFQIGDNVVVTITGLNHNQVGIGINAPKDVRIVRDDAVKRQPKDYVDGNR